jgi:hypothetical protein
VNKYSCFFHSNAEDRDHGVPSVCLDLSSTPQVSNPFVFLVWEDEVIGPCFFSSHTLDRGGGLNRVDVQTFMACGC